MEEELIKPDYWKKIYDEIKRIKERREILNSTALSVGVNKF